MKRTTIPINNTIFIRYNSGYSMPLEVSLQSMRYQVFEPQPLQTLELYLYIGYFRSIQICINAVSMLWKQKNPQPDGNGFCLERAFGLLGGGLDFSFGNRCGNGVDPFEQHHFGAVGDAATQLDDAGVAPGAVGKRRSDVVEKFLDGINLL